MNNSIKFEYTNYKGIRSKRNIIPIKLIFESNQYYGDNKNLWLLMAFDIDKQDVRSFAVEDIHFPVSMSKRWETKLISLGYRWNWGLKGLLEVLNILPDNFDVKKNKIKETIKIFKAKY